MRNMSPAAVIVLFALRNVEFFLLHAKYERRFFFGKQPVISDAIGGRQRGRAGRKVERGSCKNESWSNKPFIRCRLAGSGERSSLVPSAAVCRTLHAAVTCAARQGE